VTIVSARRSPGRAPTTPIRLHPGRVCASCADSPRITIGDHGGLLAMQHRILIADDELDVQMLLCLFFERQGHTIIRARDGQEAINASTTQVPDLILMDI